MKVVQSCIGCYSTNVDRAASTIAPFVSKRIHGREPAVIELNGNVLDFPTRADSMFCRDCNLIFLDARYDDEEMKRLYRDYRSDAYAKERESFEPGYQKVNGLIGKAAAELQSRRANVQAFLKAHIDCTSVRSVLDYGGDEGQFIPDCLSHADRFVYELSESPVGPGVVKLTSAGERAPYDLTMCCHVLEHCAWPRAIVANIARYTTRYIYIEVPLERPLSDTSKVWHNKLFHEHVNIFDAPSLRTLLEREQLTVIELKAGEIKTASNLEKTLMVLARRG